MKQIDLITEMHTDIKWMKKALQGNGTKGLISQVGSNTNWKYFNTGGLIVLSTLIGWALLVIY